MILTYQNKIEEALRLRAQEEAPNILFPAVLLSAFLLVTIAVALLVAPEGRLIKEFQEFGMVTALSAIFLAMTSSFAGLCFYLKREGTDWRRYFWLLTSLGFLFFSLDELLEFHERFSWWLEDTRIGPTTTFRTWNDVVVILYGVVAVAVTLGFLPEVLRYPRVIDLLIAGFLFYCLHTLIDSTLVHTPTKMIVEESCKLFASAFFALSMFIGVLAIIDSSRQPAAIE